MFVPPKTEILHKGVWYRTGDKLPDDYKPPKEKKQKKSQVDETIKEESE